MDMMSYLMGRNSGGGGKGAKIEVVTELPETGEANVIYLVPKETEDENNVFDEYLYVNDEWELIGSTAIDISGKQDTMQFSTMPTPSIDYLGKIVQYTGTTDANYTNGYFYIGITDGAAVPTYSWSNVEVQEKSSNVPLYTASLEVGGANSEWPSEGTLGTNDKLILQNIINDAYQKGLKFINLLITKDSARATPSTLNSGYPQKGGNIQIKPTSIWLYSLSTSQRFIYNYSSGLPFLNCIQMIINLTWNGDTATVSSASLYNTTGYFLTTDNGTAYTPSRDYNPATKKYVDDSIAAAITTTLGGSY